MSYHAECPDASTATNGHRRLHSIAKILILTREDGMFRAESPKLYTGAIREAYVDIEAARTVAVRIDHRAAGARI